MVTSGRPLEVGISSPILTRIPGVSSAWEDVATPADLAEVVRTADRLGFDHLTASEHVAVRPDEGFRGTSYWDPVASLSFIAGLTTRIRLVSSVLVLPYHHPLEIVKRFGTLDVISGGRVVLGVGIGSLREEFELLGRDWASRGPVSDEAIDAVRASFGDTRPQFAGRHFSYGDLVVAPAGLSRPLDVWVGGRSEASLTRALTRGTGWMPFGISPSGIGAMLAERTLPESFDVVLGSHPLDPSGDPARTIRALVRLRDAGASVISAPLAAESAAHYCEQLHALAELRVQVQSVQREETRA